MTYFSIFLAAWQTPVIGWLDLLWLLLQTIVALALVCGLAILIFRYILPNLNVVALNKSIVRVVDGASLDARKRLLIVEVAGKYLLLATSESGVQTISELDAAAVEAAVAENLAIRQEAREKTGQTLKKISTSFAQILDNVRQKRK